MYEMLLTYDDVVDPEVLDDVMTLLSDTNWLVVKLYAVIKYFLIVTFIQDVQYVKCCLTEFLSQGGWPCHSPVPKESALWFVGSPQATDCCEGNHLTDINTLPDTISPFLFMFHYFNGLS